MTDSQRETLIEHNYQKLIKAKTKRMRTVYFYFMSRLIAERSPEQVKRMESQF